MVPMANQSSIQITGFLGLDTQHGGGGVFMSRSMYDLKALEGLHPTWVKVSSQHHRYRALPFWSLPQTGSQVQLGQNCIELAERTGWMHELGSNDPPHPLLLGGNVNRNPVMMC